jgi:hypothetical protein
LANEIQHGQAFFLAGSAQAAAELLEIDDVAFGGAQKEHAVDLRDIDALVEDIDDEKDVEAAVGKVGAELAPGVGIGFGSQALRGNARLLEEPCHEARMLDAHTEAEGPHTPAVELAAGRDEPQHTTAFGEPPQWLAEQAHAAGFDESHEHVAAIGRGEFQFNLTPELRQTRGSSEKGRSG